jgi:beta-N-acetylhexosaminidase
MTSELDRPAAAQAGGSPGAGGSAAAGRPEVAGGGDVDAAALAGVRFLRSFDGRQAPPEILAAIRKRRASGATLFRARNVDSPGQVRDLCAALQAARPDGDPPLVIGFDQEGGQLQMVGDGATAWPGNLALGAAASVDLTRRCGRAIGAEVAAMGGTLVYAPVCDVLHPSSATPLGLRPFGDDPEQVALHAAAMTEGLQEAGIAATLKHFPGHGAAASDSHHGLPVIGHDPERLLAEDLPPFRAGIAAGALTVLPGHLAVPALTGGEVRPATTSPEILVDLLRRRLGFEGVTVSDALDMAGAGSDRGLGGTVGAAAGAGMDLLLLNHDRRTEEAAFDALRAAIVAGKLGAADLRAAWDRIMRLRVRLAEIVQPTLDVVDCEAHRRLAREIAEASITLVRDPAGNLPLPAGSGELAVVAPTPADLTPAETSSYLRVGLAEALRDRGVPAAAFAMPLDPSAREIGEIVRTVRGFETVIVGTFDAVSFPGQAELVGRLDSGDHRLLAVALRTPYDVALFPGGTTAVATYGLQPPQIEALADALTGRIRFAGRLPVRLPTGVASKPSPATGDLR